MVYPGLADLTTMISTEHWLVHDHTRFEASINNFRDLVQLREWDAIGNELNELVRYLDYHMSQEEEVLFPAYEARAGASDQHIRTLREEHDAIVDQVRSIFRAAEQHDTQLLNEALGTLESLLLVHHEKEELFFLPMASRILFGEREQLSRALNEFKGPLRARDWGATLHS